MKLRFFFVSVLSAGKKKKRSEREHEEKREGVDFFLFEEERVDSFFLTFCSFSNF